MKFKDILNEPIVIYSGRFQPFHIGHHETYNNITKDFPKKNIFIGTSNKTGDKSPFTYNEKYKIITTMFKDINKRNIKMVKNPYAPTEILEKYPDTTPYVTVVGKKDADRLVKGKYFELYKPSKKLKGYKDKGYIWIAPKNKINISGTIVREKMSSGTMKEKKDFFKKIYGSMNPEIFNIITQKLEEI